MKLYRHLVTAVLSRRTFPQECKTISSLPLADGCVLNWAQTQVRSLFCVKTLCRRKCNLTQTPIEVGINWPEHLVTKTRFDKRQVKKFITVTCTEGKTL